MRSAGLRSLTWLMIVAAACFCTQAQADPTLHEQIDGLIEAAHSGPFSPQSDDAEFVRRVYLDLTGTIPTADQVRSFLTDQDQAKRTRLIDQLLAAPEFAARMADAFHVMLVERRPGGQVSEFDWRNYLQAAFQQGKSWDQIAQEILSVDGLTEESRPAMMFYVSRGAESYDVLTRDIARLFLGMDLQCANCHDHPTIQDYKQAHYFGLQAFLMGTGTVQSVGKKDLLLVQKKLTEPLEFQSVFTGESAKTGPQLPGRDPVTVPTFEKPEEGFEENALIGKPGLAKFFARKSLATELASADNPQFARNLANRLWAMQMGRGLVEPLDLHHSSNPPSHPELLNLLSQKLIETKFEIRPFVRELLLTKTYQRSSLLPEESKDIKPESFAVANIKALSAEQLMDSVLRATGQDEIIAASIDEGLKTENPENYKMLEMDEAALAKARDAKWEEIRKTFLSAFANPPGEAEDQFNPTLAGALFFDNEKLLNEWLQPGPNNLIERLSKMKEPAAIADEIYVTILSRNPAEEERAAVVEHLNGRSEDRAAALAEIAWGLLASTEFRLNH